MSRDLTTLFDPRSVAVVGASDDPVKWGYGLARGALRGATRRAVYLVNRKGSDVLGQRTYRSLLDLPGPAELVVVAVPEAAFEETVDAALQAGARAIVAITAGLGERGEAGLARERAVAERVRGAGAVMLGPNCLGVFDARAELDIGWSELPPGAIGLVSQSGNLALELALLARQRDLGFSRFASLGNQADLQAAELLSECARDDATRVIATYIEDFRDGRAFARACHEAFAAGKPVILLPAGQSDASGRAARSHTGALVSDRVAVKAACRSAGIVTVASPTELIELAQAFLASSRPRGRRLAIFGDGGGHGVVAADLAASFGLTLPTLSAPLSDRIRAALGPTAATENPVDLAGGGEQDLSSFERIARLLLTSGEVDAAILTGYFGGYGEYGPDYAAHEVAVGEGMAHVAVEAERPLFVHTMYPIGPAATALRASGVPVYRAIEAAVRSLSAVADFAAHRPPGVPVLPPPVASPPAQEGYLEARSLLEQAGISFVEARHASTLDDALDAATELGYPVVLKALGLLHKSDAGGVALGLEDEEALERSFAEMATRLEPEGYSVERMAPVDAGVELIVGTRRDPRFGPIALVGLGGIYAEVLADVAVALAPIDRETADGLLRSLHGAPLLLGARGRPPVNLEAAASAIAALALAAAERPEIAELEINPLLVTAADAIGLDARLALAPA
jgi:acyl-CoA synthetase (NDP forming)